MSKASGSIDLKGLKVAGQTATNFFSVDSSGIMIYDGSNGTQTPSNPDVDTNNVFIDPNSLDIRKGINVLATFSAEETRVGSYEGSNIMLSNRGIAAKKSDGSEYFQVGLENASVRQDASVSEYFPEGGSQTAHLDANPYATLYGSINTGDVFDVRIVIRFRYYRTSYPYGYVNTSTSMYWSGVVQSLYRKKGTTNSWTDPDRNTSSAKKVSSIYYNATNNTFYANVSKWYFSQHYDTTNHPCSILGVTLELKGNIATPAPSYSFGINTDASKPLGFAIGNGTIPSEAGLAMGKYNVQDTNDDYALIIGNGIDPENRANAFTIDWNGNVNANGNITAGGNIVIPNNSAYKSQLADGTTERRLCFISPSDYYYYGYDSYNNNEGRSYFDGNTVYIRSKDSINMTGTIYPSANIVMPNNVSVRAKTANGNNNYQLIFASDSNNIVVGSSSWNDCYIHRVYSSGTGTVSTVPNVRILDNNRLTRTTHANSSIKIKHDIKDIENKELDPHRLYGVEVKQFIYNDDVITDKNDCRYHKEIAGFIAEQLHECYPIAVDINEKGECEAWQAQYIIPPMLKLIQEQHEEIEQLKKEVAELKNR